MCIFHKVTAVLAEPSDMIYVEAPCHAQRCECSTDVNGIMTRRETSRRKPVKLSRFRGIEGG